MGLKLKIGIVYYGVVVIIEGGRLGLKIVLCVDMDVLLVIEQIGLLFVFRVIDQYRGQIVGVMYVCGYDVYIVILFGVVEVLVLMKKDLLGQVMLIFQLVEEGVLLLEEGGVVLMLKEGLFVDFKLEVVFGLYVFFSVQVGQIVVCGGLLMVVLDCFGIKVIGCQMYGLVLWNGVDLIVVIVDLVGIVQIIVSCCVNLFKQLVVLIFGVINGGICYNIIFDEVEMVGIICIFDEGMCQQIFVDLCNVVEYMVVVYGVKVVIDIYELEGNLVMVNDLVLIVKMLLSLQVVVGKDNVYELLLQMGVEDFLLYVKEVLGMFFFVGFISVGIDLVMVLVNYLLKFLLDEKVLDVGLCVLLQVSLDYLYGVGILVG